MSLTPTTSNFIGGSQTFGAINSPTVMNMNVINATTPASLLNSGVQNVNKNINNTLTNNQQPQQQQLYHLIPIASGNISTLQLGGHHASHVPTQNSTIVNKNKNINNQGALNTTTATATSVKMCNNNNSSSGQQQQFTLEMQSNIAQIIGTALPIQNVVATNVSSTGLVNKFAAATVKAVPVQGLTVVQSNSMAPATNTANATLIQLPATGNIQRVITPAPAAVATLTTMSAPGTFSMINPNINSKLQTSQFIINSGTSKPATTTIKLNAATISAALPSNTKVIEIKPADLELNLAAQPAKPKAIDIKPTDIELNIVAQSPKPKMPAVEAATATTPTNAQPKQTQTNADKMQAHSFSMPSTLLSPHTTIRAVSTVSPRTPVAGNNNSSISNKNPNHTTQQINEIILEKLLPETTITKEPIPVTPTSTAATNNTSSNNKESTNTKATLSVLNDANSSLKITKINSFTDDLEQSENMLVIDDSSDGESSKNDDEDDDDDIATAASESAADELSQSPPRIRHISNSVVLTKTDARAGNSIRQPLSPEPANVVLMKLPNATQQTAGGSKPQNIAIPINEALTMAKEQLKSPNEPRPILLQRSNSIPEAQKCLSPRAIKRSQSLNCGTAEQTAAPMPKEVRETIVDVEKQKEETDNSSSDDLNKSNAEITFIELDDSFDEDYTDESDSSKTATPKKDHNSSNGQAKQKQSKPATTLDKNENIKTNNSANRQQQPQLVKNVQKILQKQPLESGAPITLNDENDEQIIKSLLCNEQISAVTPSSSSSASSLQEISPKLKTNFSNNNSRSHMTPVAQQQQQQKQPCLLPPPSSSTLHGNATVPLKKISSYHAANTVTPNASTRRQCHDNKIASALSMVSTFDMLNWKENNIGIARGTALRFELNEFNLLQLHERNVPPRFRIHAAYERPIYERTFGLTPKTEQSDPMLYMCRKCKTYGPAVDFLAPEFCSYTCLRRVNMKRTAQTNNDVVDNYVAKRARKNFPSTSGPTTSGSDGNVSGGANASKSNSSSYAPTTVPLPKFRWSTYLAAMRTAYAAPIDLFLNPFPTGPNPFSVGMKLEAIDPENCSLFCVCTVVEIKGYRMRLNFDGYDSIYDFWVNADSMDIFPPGWCEKTKRLLQPPRSYIGSTRQFSWHEYLRKMNAVPADKKLFTHLNGSSMVNRNPFQVGMFLEADDLNDTGKLCVASVADVLDERIRVHFDGWDDMYDYWVDISSPFIHPCGWHAGRQQLLVPPEYGNTSFSWPDYILEANTGPAAPEDFFVPREPIDYRPGMKLEVVDPRNPSLIRPASVVHRTRHRVKIIFDCWPMEYTFVLEDDSPDLHPIGWCDATGHELEPPPGYLQFKKVMPCSTPGCRGIGNMNRNCGRSHATREACPYASENWRTKCEKTPRVEGKQIMRGSTAHTTSPSQPAENKKQIQPESAAPTLPKTRGRPRKTPRPDDQPQAQTNEKQHQRPLSIDQIKTERKSVEPVLPVQAPMPTTTPTPQIKIEAVVSNGISAHKLAATQALEPHVATVKRFLCDYGPRLQQNYALWRENLAGIDITAKVQQNPLHWNTNQVCDFVIDALGDCNAAASVCCDVRKAFLKHDIDGAALLMLQQQDLTDILQFKLGPALKISAIVFQLRILVATKYEFPGSVNASSSFESESECLLGK